MIVERKQNREFWLSAVMNSIPDFVVAFAASYLVEGGWIVFIGVLFGLQLVYFAIWLKNSLWGWTRYKLFDKKRGTQHILDMLRSNNFPVPEEYIESSDIYLRNVVEDESIDMKIRLIAAGELGALNYVHATRRLQELFRLTLMYDEAIEKYGRIAVRTTAPEFTPDAPEADADENIEDEAQIVMMVKLRCEIATNRYNDFKQTGDQYEMEQFKRAKDQAIEYINRIKDEYFSGMAKHNLIRLLIHTDELDDAKKMV